MAAKRIPSGSCSIEGKVPFLIGVAGGTASGKSTVCKKIIERLGQADITQKERQVVCISQDSFYRELTSAEKAKALKGQFNFDHPSAFDEDFIYATLKNILDGRTCSIPAYDYKTNSLERISRVGERINGYTVVVVFVVRELFHMKLFVDMDSDMRLADRVTKDIMERGRDLDQVLHQYMTFVKPAFEEFCLPTKKFADIIIPRGADNAGNAVLMLMGVSGADAHLSVGGTSVWGWPKISSLIATNSKIISSEGVHAITVYF